jgi:hypothetical protein
VGLADYQHRHLSPLRIADLIHAADHSAKPLLQLFQQATA